MCDVNPTDDTIFNIAATELHKNVEAVVASGENQAEVRCAVKMFAYLM